MEGEREGVYILRALGIPALTTLFPLPNKADIRWLYSDGDISSRVER